MVNIEKIEKDSKLFERALHYRNNLIEQLANFDETLADSYLSGIPID